MKKNEAIYPELEVLVYTTVRKDADLTVSVLQNAGFTSRALTDINLLFESLLTAGAVVLSEEGLNRAVLDRLKQQMETQPKWSDLPIIMVTSGGSGSTESNDRLKWITTFVQNVTLLERPIRLATLITIVRTALSSRKKQFELKKVLEDLENSKQAAEEANTAKSMFLANMSHEIRTPLAAIVGFTSLMADQDLPVEERLQFADVIARNGDQLSSLINDILDLSKVEAGKLEIEITELSLPTLFSEISSWLRPMVEAKGLEFIVEQKSNLPQMIKVDSTRVRQILLNLVGNSVKFTRSGAIVLAIEAKPLSRTESQIFFKVSDTGIGMSEKDQERIFKPFSQADASMTRKFGGTGLGLVLSKALANAMNGELKLLSSRLNRGSQFEFSLPVEVIDQSKTAEPIKPLPENVLEGIKVLLVEDSPDNQHLMGRFLKGAGAIVTNAENGELAVQHALAQTFDVVLMDIQMPVMDGLTATKELRSKNYQGPIIALTAHALREEKERSLKAGCNDHLTKPIQRQTLIASIAAHVHRS